jgi:hypothetical protein
MASVGPPLALTFHDCADQIRLVFPLPAIALSYGIDVHGGRDYLSMRDWCHPARYPVPLFGLK